MPYSKNIPISVDNGPNDLDESARVTRPAPGNLKIELVGGRLSTDQNRDHSITVQALIDAGAITTAQANAFRQVFKAARDAIYVADGFTNT